ncbi:MAG: diguanylate cyclase [Candidatus Omnitrophica bacterium]|jgi:diguanylate cyclase (GGDEF)-like protein|nr:diguanylate cyclase [Candidatus Omnitrophota bacterium]
MKNQENIDKAKILIVDDDTLMCENLVEIMQSLGYDTDCTTHAVEARGKLSKNFYNILMVDLKLSDGDGLGLLKYVKEINPETMTIIFTGYASLESSISALNEGAFGYLQKPISIEEVKILIGKALRMQQLSIENKELLEKLKELSLKDIETEVYNHKYLIERLNSELLRAKRYALSISLAMIDVDYFNSINGLYGHAYGDKILKELAKYLKQFIRGMDVVTRYGGEEFIIILPDTDKQSTIRFTERLLGDIENHIFDSQDKKIKLKVSIGIANFPEDDLNISEAYGLIHLVEKAVSLAKERGGGRLLTLNGKEAEGPGEDTQENIENLKQKLSKIEKRMHQTFLESIYAFAKTIEAKDFYTGEHCEHMVSLVVSIGKKLNLSEKEMEDLGHAAMLHDLGKIGIPDEILLKKGKLTDSESEIIRKHPQIGAEIIRHIHFLKDVAPIILYHHERFDGFGYCSGLKGKEIPLGARIIAIADVYQALTSDRPYRKAYSMEEALKIIKEGSGTQFDPEIVKVFFEIIEAKKE